MCVLTYALQVEHLDTNPNPYLAVAVDHLLSSRFFPLSCFSSFQPFFLCLPALALSALLLPLLLAFGRMCHTFSPSPPFFQSYADIP